MKKLLSLMASIGLTVVPISSIVACSKDEYRSYIDASVSANGQSVSFEAELTLVETTDLSSLSDDYAIFTKNKDSELWGPRPTVVLKDQTDANKFNKKSGNEMITAKFIVTFSTIGKLQSDQDKTYNWLFCKVGENDDGLPSIDKVITGIKFVIPKAAIMDTAEINDGLNEITIKGRNLLLINKDATWNLTSNDAPVPQEKITIKNQTDKKIVLQLGTPIEKNEGNYFVKYSYESFSGSVSFYLHDNKFFRTAKLNWETFGDTRGTILTIQGAGVVNLKEEDVKKFKITSKEDGNVSDDLSIDLLKPPSALIPSGLPKDTRVLQLSEALLTPDTYTLTYENNSVIFIVPKAEAKMQDVSVGVDHKQLTISGENLEVISSNFDSLTLAAQTGSVPSDEELSFDADKSTPTSLVVLLTKPLNNGDYYFTYYTEDYTEIDSNIFEISDSKPDNLDNASLNSASMPYGQRIEIKCSNIPDGVYTDKVKVNGEKPQIATVSGDLLSIGLSQSINEGTKVKVEFQIGDNKYISISFTAEY